MRIAATEDVVQKGDATGVHLPSPSYWPIVAGLRPAAHRLRPDLQPVARASSAASVVVAGIYGWVIEPSDDPTPATATTTTTSPTHGPRPATEAHAEPTATPTRRLTPVD